MTSIVPARADRSAIRKRILEILEEMATLYEEYGDPESDLRNAPEYLINVNLAQGLTKTFPMLRYRLEHHASAFNEVARSAIDARVAVGKASARFDIVMLNRSNNVPRCIIEVKRGPKVIDDAKRIIAMASLDSGRPRWRHGYLVTILRRSEAEATRVVQQVEAEIQSLRATASATLPENQEVKVVSALRRIGASRINCKSTQIYGVVFHIALIDRAVSESDAADGLL